MWMPVFKMYCKLEPASVGNAHANFQFNHSSETGVQYFVDAVSQFHDFKIICVQYVMDSGFQNTAVLEIGLHNILYLGFQKGFNFETGVQ